ncbi:MAG: hypothetical protein ACTSR3_15965 [Candidatus Helarchaeota archaeon]
MGVRIEDIRALLTLTTAILAAYLPFYLGFIEHYFYKDSLVYYVIIEFIQAIGGISISVYFSVRRIEGMQIKINKREPLGLPKHGIRAFLLCNAVVSIFLGFYYFSISQNISMLNLPFIISMLFSLVAWLWPPQKEKLAQYTQEKKVKTYREIKYKQWELELFETRNRK